MTQRRTPRIAVVGATGMVGRTMIRVLGERGHPTAALSLVASGRSAGSEVSVDGERLRVVESTPDAFDGIDIALFSAGAEVARSLAPEAVARGATVIDNSSAWRMDAGVPLVVSQVNPDDRIGRRQQLTHPRELLVSVAVSPRQVATVIHGRPPRCVGCQAQLPHQEDVPASITDALKELLECVGSARYPATCARDIGNDRTTRW